MVLSLSSMCTPINYISINVLLIYSLPYCLIYLIGILPLTVQNSLLSSNSTDVTIYMAFLVDNSQIVYTNESGSSSVCMQSDSLCIYSCIVCVCVSVCLSVLMCIVIVSIVSIIYGGDSPCLSIYIMSIRMGWMDCYVYTFIYLVMNRQRGNE